MFSRFTLLMLVVLAIAAIGIGCSTSDNPIAPNNQQIDETAALSDLNDTKELNDLSAGWGHYGHQTVMFTVRIENVSNGMTLHLSNGETAAVPLAPGAWAVTRLFNPLFRVGVRDLGKGMEELAEDGDPSILASNLEMMHYVKSSGVFNTPVGAGGPAPAFPGDAYEFVVEASPGDRLSLATMFVQSNDLFYANSVVGVPLFRGWRPMDGDVTRYFRLWDAGTEVNEEPGLGPNQAPRQSGPDTGETEHLRVLPPRDEYTYPATDEVIKVTITPMDQGA